jgi:hypothetical protein
MIITRKPMHRRTILRGLSTAMALPLLDAMMPATARAAEEAAAVRKRLQVFYFANGMMMQNFTPAQTGGGYAITPILKPLEPFRDKVTIFSGLDRRVDRNLKPGQTVGSHAPSCGSYLTGVTVVKTEGAGIGASISMDQVVASEFGKETQFPSLELGLEAPSMVGTCESGYSCAYTNTMSWSNATTPLPVTNSPRILFERLFGDGDSLDAASRTATLRRRTSLLDFLREDARRLAARVGAGDRIKLDEYLTSVRDVEKRIQKMEKSGTGTMAVPNYTQSTGAPDSFADQAKVMIDLQVIAMQADLTRVVTLMLAREMSGRSYPEIGVPEANHALSHHGKDAEKMAKLTRVNTLHMEQVAYYLKRMSETREGQGTLLDSTLVLAGASLADPNAHEHRKVPTIVAGGLVRGGRHIQVEEGTPLTNLMLSMMDSLGVHLDNFGDSTGRLTSFAA